MCGPIIGKTAAHIIGLCGVIIGVIEIGGAIINPQCWIADLVL